MSIGRLLFERPKNTGSRFGFIAVLLIAIALIFPAFYGIGGFSESVMAYQMILIVGLMMSIFFSYLYGNTTKTKRQPKGITGANIQKQFSVLIAGIVAGVLLVIVNGLTNMGGNLLLGSANVEELSIISNEMIYLALLAGVAEELFFRGFIQTLIRTYVPSLIFAVLPSALIFALFHYFAYQTTTAFIVLFILGVFLGLLHEIFNDIGVPMIAHIVNNIFAILPVVMTLIAGNIVIIMLVVGVMIMSFLIASTKRKR